MLENIEIGGLNDLINDLGICRDAPAVSDGFADNIVVDMKPTEKLKWKRRAT